MAIQLIRMVMYAVIILNHIINADIISVIPVFLGYGELRLPLPLLALYKMGYNTN
jgi:hypothetical protein